MSNFVINFVNDVLDKNILVVYAIFFVISFIQMIFPPLPGDLVLSLQGYLSFVSMKLEMCTIFLNSATATYLGSICVYKFGYIKGNKVFEYRLINKFISKKNRFRAERLFEQYGFVAIILSKFLLGINSVIILFAGIFKVKPKVAYISFLISIIIHHLLYIMIGRVLAHYFTSINSLMSSYTKIIWGFTIFIVLGAIGVLAYFLNKRKVVD